MSTLDENTTHQLSIELIDRDSVASRMAGATTLGLHKSRIDGHLYRAPKPDKELEELYSDYCLASNLAYAALRTRSGFFSTGPDEYKVTQAMSAVRHCYEKVKRRYHHLKEFGYIQR